MSSSDDNRPVTAGGGARPTLPVAGLATRTGAALIDAAILGTLLLVGYGLVAGVLTQTGSGGASSWQPSGAAILLLSAAGLLVVVTYFTVSEVATAGRTAGKAAMGLRVTRLDGGTAGFTRCLLRSLAYAVDLPGIGLILMFFHPRCRRIGDLLAGTVVVGERAPARWAPGPPPPPVLLRSLDAGPSIDGLGNLGEREFGALRTFLSRPGLPPGQRSMLAARIGERLLERMDLPPGAPERMWPPELLLERLYLQLAPRFGTAIATAPRTGAGGARG